MPIEKLTQAAGKERNKFSDFSLRYAAETLADSKEVLPSRNAPCINLRRRFQEEGLKIACESLQLIIDPDEGLRILGGMFAKFGHCPISFCPPGHNASFGKRDLNCRIARHHAQPVLREPQVTDYLGPQHARDVRCGR